MKIIIKTLVRESVQKVFAGFDASLFLALKPPLVPLKLVRFDGCHVGDEVHLDLGLGFWVSKITQRVESEDSCYFVDEGTQLPFPLKTWHHQHLIQKDINGTLVIDNIDFSSGVVLIDFFLYPFLYFMFWLRKPIYKKVFGVA